MAEVTKVRVEIYAGEELINTVEGIGIYGVVPASDGESDGFGIHCMKMGGLYTPAQLKVAEALGNMSEELASVVPKSLRRRILATMQDAE